jgi:hypothetical protein
MKKFGEHRREEIDPFQFLQNIVSVIFLVCLISLGCFVYVKETTKTPHTSEDFQIENAHKFVKTQNDINQTDRDWLYKTIKGNK